MKISPFSIGIIVVTAATLLLGGLLFRHGVLAGDTFNREEARHALYSLWIYRDVVGQDWQAFWYDTGRQMYWPFLHSWVKALGFLVFGVGYASARGVSFIFFAASLFLIYLLCNRIFPKSGPKSGALAVLLMLSSPLAARFSVLNTFETMGMFIFLGAGYLYIESEERKDLFHYILLAVLIGLSIYTNYLYAYLILSSVLVAGLARLGPLFAAAWRLRKKGEKAALPFVWWSYRKLILAVVVGLFTALWFSFSFSRKLLLFVEATFRYSGGEAVSGIWETLFFYPKVIIYDLTHWPLVGLFILVSLFLPQLAGKFHGLNKLYTFVWTTLLLLTLTIFARLPQMLYIAIPFIIIIASTLMVYFFEEIAARVKIGALAAALLAAALLVIAFPALRDMYFPEVPSQNMISVLDYIENNLPPAAALTIPIDLPRLGPEVCEFHFRNRSGELLTEPESFSRAEPGRYYVRLRLEERSPYLEGGSSDSQFRWDEWISENESRGRILLYRAQKFDRIGITAQIFKGI